MSEILTTAELDAIIDAFREPDSQDAAPKVAAIESQGPELNQAQLSGLRTIHSSFAWVAEAGIGDLIGGQANIYMTGQEQMPYGQFVQSCEHSLMVTISAPPLKGRIQLAIGIGLAQVMLDTYFRSAVGAANRTQFNEIEMSVLRDSVEKIMAGYVEAWRQLARLKPAVKAIEPGPGKNQVALESDLVLVANLEVRIGLRKEYLRLCLPNQVLKPFLASLTTRNEKPSKPDVALLELQTDASVMLQASVPDWKPGQIDSGSLLPLGGDGTFEILSGGLPVGTGELVSLDGAIVVRVLEVGNPRRKRPRTA